MRAYIALIRQRMIANMQYRIAFFGKITTNIFWGFVRTAIVVAYYTYGEGSAQIDIQQAVAMIWLGQIAMNLLSGVGMDMDVWQKISSGAVGYELLRPLDLYGHWYAAALAVKIAPFLMSILPIGLVAYLLPAPYGLMPPPSFLHLLCCLITLITGLFLTCATICLSYAMCMDTRVGDGPARIFMTLVQLLGGSGLPLQLWPDGLQRVLAWQPFAVTMDVPLRFYTGSAAISSLPGVVLQQVLWGLVFIALGRFWIERNLKTMIIQGG